MLNEEENHDKALTEHEKKNLLFYVRYRVKMKLSEKEFERLTDIHLDRILEIRKRSKK